MPPPTTRSKPRFALFNVGKSKPSPARAASTKRASLRHSAIRTEALKLPPELPDAGQPVPTRPQGGEAPTSDLKDTQRVNASQIPSRGDDSMKDTALPPLPNDRPAAALAHPSSGSALGGGGGSPRARPEPEPHRPSLSRPSLSTDAGTAGQPDKQQGNSNSPPLPPKSASHSSSRHPQQAHLQPSATTPTMNPPSRPLAPSRTQPHLHVHIPTAQPQPQHPQPHPSNANAHAHTSSGGNLFKKFASKLRSSTAPEVPSHPSSSSSSMPRPTQPSTHPSSHPPSQPQPQPQAHRTPQKKRSGLRTVLPALPKAPVPAAPPNDFTSREQRQAALRARGLLPNVPRAYRDENGYMVPLSEQEAELDRRFAVVARGEEEKGRGESEGGGEGESEARKIREAWLARNRELVQGDDGLASRDGGDSTDGGPAASSSTSTPTKNTDTKARAASTSTATPPLAAEPDSPSNSSAVTEKVSRWLQSATDGPTPLNTSAAASTVQQQTPLTESPRPSLTSNSTSASASAPAHDETASPAGTVRAKPRKEKPPPIVVAAPGSLRASAAKKDAGVSYGKNTAHVVAVAVVGPSDSEGSTSEDGQLHTRGRGTSQSQSQSHSQTQPQPPQLAHTDSSTSSGSRTTTLPALSPTRTVSSSGAESTLPTPTTASCQRGDVSISHGSSSHSSDQSHSGVRASARAHHQQHHPHAHALAGTKKYRAGGAGVGGLMQSSIEESFSESEERDASVGGVQSTSASEEEEDSDEGEFGAGGMPAQTVPLAAVVRPRPQRVQTAEQAAEMQASRKSFSLFGKKSATVDSSHNARGASSMSNLRRAFAGGFAAKLQVRPRSSIDPSTSQQQPQHLPVKRSKLYDASHLPASPSYTQQHRAPPSSFPGISAGGGLSVPLQGRTTGVGLRPRQPVAPTMHSRGSILHQAHFIEDDESRRLSEMAFLT